MVAKRVLFLGRSVYDYLEASLVEGFTNLGYQVEGLSSANYVSIVKTVEEITPTFEFIFVNSKSLSLLGPNQAWAKGATIIFVDGSDDPFVYRRGLLECDLYLKRELLKFPLRPKSLKPISFGIENRYYEAMPNRLLAWMDRHTDIFCAVSPGTNRSRPKFLEALYRFSQERGLVVFGDQTGERAYDGKSPLPMATPKYHLGLAGSKVGVSLWGAGQDCARFWETLASGALLISEKVTVVRNAHPVGGKEALYFENREQLDAALRWAFDNPIEAAAMAQAGYEWGLKFGRTQYLVLRIIEQGQNHFTSKGKVRVRAFLSAWTFLYNIRARLYLKWFRFFHPLVI